VKAGTSVVTDWRLRDEDLFDMLPGEACERVITPQKHVVLRQVVVHHLKLVRLQIGNVFSVPFEICGEDGDLRTYRPAVPADARRQLTGTGAQVLAADAIRVVAALDVRLILRNDGTSPHKPIVSLLVQEEAS